MVYMGFGNQGSWARSVILAGNVIDYLTVKSTGL